MGGDLEAPKQALVDITNGINLAHAELKDLGMIGEASAGRGFSDLALSGMELGHGGLTAEFQTFCDRWEWGVRALTLRGNAFAQGVGLSAGSYAEREQYVKDAVKIRVNSLNAEIGDARMLHEIEDIKMERSRTSERPDFGSAPPLLAHFDLTLDGSATAYADRLRNVMRSVLTLAMSQEFADEDIPVHSLPEWFINACRGAEGPAEPFAQAGSRRYSEETGSAPWELQNWLYRFDPELEVRGWSWWDLTSLPDGRLRVWTDTWGEPFFAWEDLRWLLYTCGARTIDGPVLRGPEVWAQEPSA